MIRRFPIRRKLMTALAVPLMALTALAAFEIFQTRHTAQLAGEEADLAMATVAVDRLVGTLQQERSLTAAHLAGDRGPGGLDADSMEEARPLTDQALRELEDTVAARSSGARAAYRPALDTLAGAGGAVPSLAELRQRVDERPEQQGPAVDLVAVESFGAYGHLIGLLHEANVRIAAGFDDPDLRHGSELVSLVIQQGNTVAEVMQELSDVAVSPDGQGVMTTEQLGRVAALRTSQDRTDTLIRERGIGPYRAVVDDLFASEALQRFSELVDEGIATGIVDVDAMLEMTTASDTSDLAYQGFGTTIAEELRRQADGLSGGAGTRQQLYAALGLAVMLLAVAAAWLVARSITRPLRSLTDQATDMADRRLPDAVDQILATPLGEDVVMPQVQPVRVETRDEVADVAVALSTVQDSALELAVEQAVLRRNISDSFVNLGRRNQNLLGRQLDFITELEHNETDPDTLGNLFRLDHLATRMRRNAESLLVLAGIDPPRKWAAPVRITDAIRAALGEVEDYQRVTVRAVEPATILGSAAADVAHVLAELIENALIFSPPDQTVEIRGRAQPGPLGAQGYALAIIDAGLGMVEEELARSNRRLAGAESFTIAPSRYLGHYVAGNLASRHGISVRLQNNVGPGIAATVDLPPTLLTTEPQSTEADAAAGAPALPAPPPPPPPSPRPSPSPVRSAPPAPGRVPPPPPAPGAPRVPMAPPAPGRVSPPFRGGPRDPRAPARPAPTMPAAPAAGAAPIGPPPRAAASGPAAPVPPASDPAAFIPAPPAPDRRSPWTPGASAASSASPPPPPPLLPLPAARVLAAGLAPSGEGWQPPPAPPAPTPPGGLARRVPGAQVPAREPVKVRRSGQPPRPSLGPDVHEFLASLNAGVQQGRHEADH